MATTFSLNPIRFEDIRQGVVDYLKEYSDFKGSFDFDGSNIAYQIEALSYVTMLLSYDNVQKANNIFLDTTEIRKNAISLAKPMGYRPKRKISSQFTGTMEYYGEADGQSSFASNATITIPANTIFTSSPSGYKFINLDVITLRYVNDVLLQGDFILTEGSFKYVTTFGTGKSLQVYTVNSLDVEENNLNVYIRNTNTDRINNTQWTYAPSFFQIVDDDDVFFVEEDITDEYKPKIIFGNGILGAIPTLTETIEIEYLKSRGDVGNDETSVDIDSYTGITTSGGVIFDFTKFTIILPTGQKSYGGEDNETLEQINFNANRFYSTGGRGVIKSDLIALLSRNDSSMLDYNVESGPVLFPDDETTRGLTYITAIPASLDEDDFLNNAKLYLSEIEEASLRPALDAASVISTNRLFSKPTYLYLDVNPFIEVPETFSSADITTAIASVSDNLETFYTNNLYGLGKSLKYTKFTSSVTDTAGIISADLELTHNFIINYDTFYNSKSTFLTLPVLFSKDANGQIIYDTNNNPSLTNFIKKRDDVISYENSSRIIDNHYTQFTLPINLSPIYGELTATNSTRYMYNIDISEEEFITFQLIGAGSAKVLSFEGFKFTDANDVEYIPNIFEESNDAFYTIWQVQLNSRAICKLQRDKATNIFSISNEEIAYLTETVGVQSLLGDNTDLITLEEITETSETGIETTYYSLKFLVENDAKSDIRIYSRNKLCKVTLDNHLYQWSTSEETTYNSGAITFAISTSDFDTAIIDQSEGASNLNLFDLLHFNGTFTLDNLNDNYLGDYDQRNDLLLYAEYTLEQDSNEKTYEFSSNALVSTNTEGETVQIITLNAKKQIEIEVIGNSDEFLDGKYFKIWSANDVIEYWIWFHDDAADAFNNGNPLPEPDTPNAEIKLIEIDLTGLTSETQVAAQIQSILSVDVDFLLDFVVTVDGTDDTKLLFVGVDNGKSTDIVDGINSVTGFDRSSGFDFTSIPVTGGDNVMSDISDILPGDFIQITDTTVTQVTSNLGIFEVYEVDYTTTGTVTVYNRRGTLNITGIGEITHWTLTDGTFGDFTIYTYDTFHEISIGTVNYETGELLFNDNVKGYTDFENKEVIIRNVKEIFNQYSGSTVMDKIRVLPIDSYTTAGTFLGQNNSYDGRFNQYLIANITQPTVK